ncbi:PTS sugar transporter subunit IIA [Mycetocola reblochoni]|uniref:Mannitol-specific phosphotransferase enzyme IIA component n=2 Tax=Mycetocola reblochoni TaxID=331618 RepID=A0A1R4I8V7_9MICO|nr:PTS sugar transporter subunit IIA [Mycetocola reblochoni]RLP69168.1 PTS mannitol transporter subunit IIA [Mycetocola reblochoni]SJN16267.1 PTS system, mannitol-specific IIA component [Mycetocola reblochoni REB411]
MSGNVLTRDRVRIVTGPSDRDSAIRAAGAQLVEAGAVTPPYVEAMLQREATVSTFMGNGLAIPHGTNEAKDEVRSSALSVTRYETPIDWAGEPVSFVIGIAGADGGHLELLSGIAILFSEEDSVQALRDAPDEDALFALFDGIGA